MSNYSSAGAWLPSAVFQIKARFRGKIHQSRGGQEKLGICNFKGMHIHIKTQFLSEILKINLEKVSRLHLYAIVGEVI